MPSARVGKQCSLWLKKGPVERLRFCICAHGKDAHRNGHGRCLGERWLRGSATWIDCGCDEFVETTERPKRVKR